MLRTMTSNVVLRLMALMLVVGLAGCASAPCSEADYEVGGACYDDGVGDN